MPGGRGSKLPSMNSFTVTLVERQTRYVMLAKVENNCTDAEKSKIR